MIVVTDLLMFITPPCGDILVFITFMEFMRRMCRIMRLFVDEPITPNTQSATVKVSENDN